LPYFLNTFEPETTVFLGIPLLVVITEIFEVFLTRGGAVPPGLSVEVRRIR